ncbi:Major facilitator superfamily domain, general substrate transporter [Niveomyces insectorum RCEF 264]|uniref:Major facilitator superfamily domain, general substrate transporter n=1 Tax=Niveomyces insectorum RCEF 264 TaxID=1081102 RepID=A0A167RBA7_9HYPO|nr:Major facilitator superfamily domain, general substrate transporter [Niveomyces insectorum RCEF 264]
MDEKGKPTSEKGVVSPTPEGTSVEIAFSGGQIDRAVEKRMLLKFDVAVMGCFGVLYLLANLDRNNLGNSETMGLPKDLGLVGNQFGNAISVFYSTYVFFEVPYSVLLKIVGPKNLLSTCMFLWGVVGMATAFVQNAGQLYACRVLMGIFEACLIPSINTYLGMVYLRSEMSMRAAVYYAFSAIAGAFGGLLASAASLITNDRLPTWSWLFLIEGLITIAVAPIVFFVFPKDPFNAWFLNDKEKETMRLRYVQNPHLDAEETFTWAAVFEAWKDPKTYVYAVQEFCIDFSLFGFTNFLPSLLHGMGFEGVRVQLMTVPVYAWATISFFGIAWLADRFQKRGPFLLFALLCAVLGYAIMLGTDNSTARFVSVFILATSVFTTTGLDIVWLNSNVSGHFKRATAVGTVLTISNISGAVAGQIYRSQDQPRYLPAVKTAMGITCVSIATCVSLMVGYVYTNKKRERKLAEMGGGEQNTSEEAWRLGQKNDMTVYFRYTL